MSLGLIILLRACREIDDKCDHHSGNSECHNKTGDIENETKLEKEIVKATRITANMEYPNVTPIYIAGMRCNPFFPHESIVINMPYKEANTATPIEYIHCVRVPLQANGG